MRSVLALTTAAARSTAGAVLITLLSVAVLPAQSAPGDSGAAVTAVERVEIRPVQAEAPGGVPVRFSAVAFDSTGRVVEGLPVSWFADSYQQVSVDSTGTAVGREIGAVRVGAAIGGKVGTALLTVTELPIAELELQLPGGAARMFVGQSARLDAHATTSLGARALVGTGILTDLELDWRSSDPPIVAVTGPGRVLARAVGSATVEARDPGGDAVGALEIRVEPNPVTTLEFGPPAVAGREGETPSTASTGGAAATVRTGDVVRLPLSARGAGGTEVEGLPVVVGVTAPGGSAWVEEDGVRFVAEEPGIYTVVASAGTASAQVDLVARRRTSDVEVVPVGRAIVTHTTSTDFAMFEGVDGRDYLIQGTIPGSVNQGVPTEIGDRYYVWDITDPSTPVLTDSVIVDARRASDPRVGPGGRWAVLTHEGDPSRRNGVTFVDLSEPAHPRLLTRFTDRLEGGVHNTWIDGHHVFAVSNGTNNMVILDASDPAHPRIVSEFGLPEGWRRVLHDIWVDDGLAYLSYWLDGLVVVDVGNGVAGGSLESPVQVSQLVYDLEPFYGPGHIMGTHTAWRDGDYVFVGDEVFPWNPPDDALPVNPRGRIHVVDVSDLERPRIVAWYEVPEAGSHCVWVADGKLYVANYQAGLRVVDVTGELRGDLYAQGRELARFDTAGRLGEAAVPFKADAWGIQIFKGRIFVADSHTGTWILELRPRSSSPPGPLAGP